MLFIYYFHRYVAVASATINLSNKNINNAKTTAKLKPPYVIANI